MAVKKVKKKLKRKTSIFFDFIRPFLTRPDVPKATARFGSSLNAHIIKEGDDVYFECSIKANPRVTVVSWSHNVRQTRRKHSNIQRQINIIFWVPIMLPRAKISTQSHYVLLITF